jgi:RES domain-containing protein
MTPHNDFQNFYNVLADPRYFTPWQGNVVRKQAPRWLSRPYRFTGLGSVRVGGRYSVKGLMPSVYASDNPATLDAELNYKGLKYGWQPSDFTTLLQIGMRWKLQAVIDLSSRAVLASLGVTGQALSACDWEGEQMADREPLTQAIARAAFERFAEGLVVPSARRLGGLNVVYFPTHRRDGTEILTNDEANIPVIPGLT